MCICHVSSVICHLSSESRAARLVLCLLIVSSESCIFQLHFMMCKSSARGVSVLGASQASKAPEVAFVRCSPKGCGSTFCLKLAPAVKIRLVVLQCAYP